MSRASLRCLLQPHAVKADIRRSVEPGRRKKREQTAKAVPDNNTVTVAFWTRRKGIDAGTDILDAKSSIKTVAGRECALPILPGIVEGRTRRDPVVEIRRHRGVALRVKQRQARPNEFGHAEYFVENEDPGAGYAVTALNRRRISAPSPALTRTSSPT